MAPTAYSYIRFSRPEQIRGDSLPRQLEATEKYCKEHGLTLDNTLKLQDLGLSAFHGLHKTKGKLGYFLKLVEAGQIPVGSYLIVENLDRLSRQDVLEALNQFISIIQAGITLVTLTDGMKYSLESVTDNWVQLIISITYMARAFDESLRKSQRLTSAWKTKRTKVTTHNLKLTARAPLWLRLSDDRTTYLAIPEATTVINLIYDMKLEGKGSDRIARELNATDLWKPAGRRNRTPSWRASYIDKLLRNNRALIGEFQPYRRAEGRRVKEGSPISDYYPAIIPIEKYNKVQTLIGTYDATKPHAGGRNDQVSNLFGHLAMCSVCGSPMQYVNKGYTSKGGQYLKCDKELRKVEGGCSERTIKYAPIEKNILVYCVGLQVGDILPTNKQQVTELRVLNDRLQTTEGALKDVATRLKNLYDTIETTANPKLRPALQHRGAALLLEQEKLQDELRLIRGQINTLANTHQSTAEQLTDLQELIKHMGEISDAERVAMRLKLRSQLRRLIKRIVVYTHENRVAVFFTSGQRRLIDLTTGRSILDAIPPKDIEGK